MNVSIVVTSYNYDRFLREAIDGALAQTHSPLDVVVVDDGSSDTSPAIIADYGDRIVPVFKPNGGQASAMNAGFDACRGDVVLFLDSDDVLLPKAAEEAAARLASRDVVKAHWPLWEIDDSGRRTGAIWPVHDLASGDLRDRRILHGLAEHDWPPTSGNAWARHYLERVLPIPNEPYRTCPDIYLAGLAPVYGRVELVSEPQSLYRVHGGNHLDRIAFDEELARIDFSLAALADQLWAQGHDVDLDEWRNRSPAHRLNLARRELLRVIPAGESVVVIDQDELRFELGSWKTVPFPERNGEYWGRPSDGAAAVEELERLHRLGARYVVVGWPAFWWLDHYDGLQDHLKKHGSSLLENERLRVFRLDHP